MGGGGLCPCFRVGISRKKRTMASGYGHFSTDMPYVMVAMRHLPFCRSCSFWSVLRQRANYGSRVTQFPYPPLALGQAIAAMRRVCLGRLSYGSYITLWQSLCPPNGSKLSNEARPRERSDRGRFLPLGKKPLHNGSYEHRVTKIKKQGIFLYQGCLCV